MVKISRQTCINDEDLWESKKIGGIRLNPDTRYDADVGEEIIRDISFVKLIYHSSDVSLPKGRRKFRFVCI